MSVSEIFTGWSLIITMGKRGYGKVWGGVVDSTPPLMDGVVESYHPLKSCSRQVNLLQILHLS